MGDRENSTWVKFDWAASKNLSKGRRFLAIVSQVLTSLMTSWVFFLVALFAMFKGFILSSYKGDTKTGGTCSTTKFLLGECDPRSWSPPDLFEEESGNAIRRRMFENVSFLVPMILGIGIILACVYAFYVVYQRRKQTPRLEITPFEEIVIEV